MRISWPLGLMLSKVYTTSCTVLSNTVELSVATMKSKAEEKLQTHMTRNSSFKVKVKEILHRPREACSRLRLPGLLEKRRMNVARLSALCLYRL
jgi:hypothetical protein